MFDIAFSEMLLIGVVALVVIGPEKLPKVARTMGHLFGRLQRYVSQVKSDINREMEASELSKVKTEFESAAQTFRRDVETQARSAEDEIRAVEREIDRELKTGEGIEAPPAAASGEATALPAESPPAPEAPAPAPAAEPPSPASPQLELAIGEPPAKAGGAP